MHFSRDRASTPGLTLAVALVIVAGAIAQGCFGGDGGGGSAGTSAGASGGAGTSGGAGGTSTGGAGTGGTGIITGSGGSGVAGSGVSTCDCGRVCGGFADAKDCPGNECECPTINCACDAICRGETSQAACPGDVECVCEPAPNNCAASGDELVCPTQTDYCLSQCQGIALPCPVDGTCIGGILKDCDCSADPCDLGQPIGGSVCAGFVVGDRCFDRREDACACDGCTLERCVTQETNPPQVFCHWDKP